MYSSPQTQHGSRGTRKDPPGLLLAILCLALAGLLLPAQRAMAGPVELLVPAYGNPCCGDGAAMWTSLINTARDARDNNLPLHLNVIFNPASGPGATTDPNYYNPSNPLVGHQLVHLRNAGGSHVTIYGYVATNYGNFAVKPLATITNEIDTYQTLYPNLVDGIFLDEMSNLPGMVTDYHTIYDYIKNGTPASSYRGGPVIGNPGTQTVEAYLLPATRAADTLVNFENTGAAYLNNYSAPAWVNNYPAQHFAHLIHTRSGWSASVLDLAEQRHAGMLYVTDDALPNPWDTLSSYWPAEVRAVEAPNGATVTQALWVFSDAVTDLQARQTLVNRSAASGVTDLYLSVYAGAPNSAGRLMYEDSALADLIRQAHLNKIRVWAAYGDPGWADPQDPAWPGPACNSTFPLRRMLEVMAYNAANPTARLDGVILDVEPAGTPDFVALLTLYQCTHDTLQPAGLKLAVAIRFFWDTPVQFSGGGPLKPAYQHIIDLDLAQVVVMGYRDFAGTADCAQGDGIVCLDQEEIAYADSLGKARVIVVGVETQNCVPGCGPDKVTFFEEGLGVLNAEVQLVAQQLDTHVSFGGFAIHRYTDAYLQGTAAWPEVNPSFPGVSQPLDLIFVIDTTGSMWDDIAAVQAAATTIVTHIDAQVRNYRIAVVSYEDFPVSPYGEAACGDATFHDVLGFSSDRATIVGAIQGLSLRCGGDAPEAVLSGLLHAIALSWRPQVRKAIILMGDAPPHDPEPFTNFTAATVIAAAEAADPVQIYPIAIGSDLSAQTAFAALATGTGGRLFKAPSATEVVNAITEAVDEIIDQPPNCDFAVADPAQIWPPHHQLVPVAIRGVVDPDGNALTLTITGITQDEPVRGLGSGNTAPDGFGVGGQTAFIRAERDGKGNGRVYAIAFRARDSKGRECTGTVKTSVPHDQGTNTVPVDDGQRYNSTAAR